MTPHTSDELLAVEKLEPRWAPIVSTIIVYAIISALPSRYHAFPAGVPIVFFAFAVASMLWVQLSGGNARARILERIATLSVVVITTMVILWVLRSIITDMLASTHTYGSVTLLTSATAIWIINFFEFAMLYWQIDRMRRDRIGNIVGGAYFQFAEEEDAHPNVWVPYFIDYLFLAFVSSTSFTPPDYARPKSRPAKVLLMLQATISLVTLFLIAARAIGTLS